MSFRTRRPSSLVGLGLALLRFPLLTLPPSLLAIQTQAASPEHGSIQGLIVDGNSVALPELEIKLQRPGGAVLRTTTSNLTGEYQFTEVPPGDYQIWVESSGVNPDVVDVQVAQGSVTQRDIQVRSLAPGSSAPEEVGDSAVTNSAVRRRGDELVMEVTAKKRLVQSAVSSSVTEYSSQQIRHLPQGTETSLSKLITSTSPGVVPGGFGQMFFRGNHANIQYQIDGVQMPESPTNAFGPAFSPRNFERMEVITGGIPAQYGQRLSAVINIVTKSGAEEPGGELELNYGTYNTISPHLLYGGSNSQGDLRYYFGLNYNQTDRGIDTPQPRSYTDLTQGGSEAVHDRANANSEFGKIDWQLDNENKFSLMLFHAYSFFQIPNYPANFKPTDPYFNPGLGHQHPGDDPDHHDHDHGHAAGHDHGSYPTLPPGGRGAVYHGALDAGSNSFIYTPPNTDDGQSEQNIYLQTVWRHTFSEVAFLQLAPYYKYSQVRVTNDPVNDLATSPTGATPIVGADPVSFSQNRHLNNAGLKLDYTWRPNEFHLIKSGAMVQGSRSDGLASFQRSLQEPAYGFPIEGTGFFEGAYIQDDYFATRTLIFNVGLRFDANQFTYREDRSAEWMFQPRLGLTLLATESTKIHLFYGKLFQPASLENLRVTFNRSNPNPAAYDIKAQRDDYYEIGVAQQLSDSQVIMANAYYRDSVNVLDETQLLRTSLVQPINYAQGFAYGAELSWRGTLSAHLEGYANYSYSIAKGKGRSGGAYSSDEPVSDRYFFLDHVQVHTANAGLTYSYDRFWATIIGLYGSGLRTGPVMDQDLPFHFTFDLSVGYAFSPSSVLHHVRVSADLLNIFDNRYPITLADPFNGSHYAVGRQAFVRVARQF